MPAPRMVRSGIEAMGTSSKELAGKLRKLAQRQHGCFTAAQAIETGYADSVHLYHVRTGKWTRVYRGVYRLADQPASPASRCMAALLWTRNKSGTIQGVLAADTAEALQNESLAEHDPIHVLVPKTFRRSSPTPKRIKIQKTDKKLHITLNIFGIPSQISQSNQTGFQNLIKNAQDRPDYYDLIDYYMVIYDSPE